MRIRTTFLVLGLILCAVLAHGKKSNDTRQIQVVDSETASAGRFAYFIPGAFPVGGVADIAQENVHVIIDGVHVNLSCQAGGWHKCAGLQPGYYNAEIKGDSVWVYCGDLGGKEHKIKYRNAGGW
jgi:hypothetical protein